MRATAVSLVVSISLVGACGSDDGGSGGDGSVAQARECARYIECVGAAAPDDVNDAIVAFGEASRCWDRADRAADCARDCADGLASLRGDNPGLLDCAECEDDLDCQGGEIDPFCAVSEGICVQCRADDDCEPDAPFCKATGGCSGDECDTEDVCDEGVCKSTPDGTRCGPCESDDECPRGLRCGSTGRCAACTSDDDCAQPQPLCLDPDTPEARCVACRDAGDCPAGQSCEEEQHVCI